MTAGPFPLKDTTAFSVVSSTEQTLNELISKNSHSLREVSFGGLGGSVGNVIKDRLGRERLGRSGCFSGWQDLEDDIDGFPAPSLVEDSDGSESSCSSTGSESLVEVAPGIEKSLKCPGATWQAIKDGRTVKAKCSSCSIDLHCVEAAAWAVCPNCWVASSVDHGIGDIQLEFDDGEGTNEELPPEEAIAIGIREADIIAWLEEKS